MLPRKECLYTGLFTLTTFLLVVVFITSNQLQTYDRLSYVYTSRIVEGSASTQEEMKFSVHEKQMNSNFILDHVRKKPAEEFKYLSLEDDINTKPTVSQSTTREKTTIKQSTIEKETVMESIEVDTEQTDAPSLNDLTEMPITQTQKTTTAESRGTVKTSDSPSSCEPIQNVVFLKTHKTGSSTILNILQRYSDKRNLPVVLPRLPVGNHRLGWPYAFRSKYVFEYEDGKKYNIFANHARYDRSHIMNIMENPEKTKFVTILRDPLYQLESSSVYLGFDRIFNITKSNIVQKFLNKVEKNEKKIWKMTRRPRSSHLYLAKNPNTYDLGFPTWAQNDSSVMKIVDKVEKDFNLIMLSDFMLESLVLLKDELCWELQDVVYFTLNKRPKKYRQNLNDNQIQRQRVRNWNRIDYELYDYFNQTFWEKIKMKGDRFQNDVKKLKEMNKELEEKCIDHGTHYDKSQPWFPILGYKIKDEAKNTDYYDLCVQMIRSEIHYNNVLRQKQSVRNWRMPTKKPSPKPTTVTTKVT